MAIQRASFGTLAAFVIGGLFVAQGALGVAPLALPFVLSLKSAPPATAARRDPVDVVLISDASGPNKNIGVEMEQGAKDAIEKRGLSNDIRLIVRDDGGRAEAVSALAEGAAAGFHTLAIIGPTEAEAYRSVASSAEQGRVVAIMPIGAPTDTPNPDWVFTLQGPVTRDGELLGRVIQKLARGGDVVLLTEPDAAPAPPAGGSIASEAPETTSGALLKGLARAYSDRDVGKVRRLDWTGDARFFFSASRANAVVIDLPQDAAATALKSLRLTGYDGVVVGYGDATLVRFPELLASTIQESVDPGFFTDGMICPVPFTGRIASSRSQALIKEYVAAHHSDPSWAYAYGYDAGLTIAEFAEAEKAKGKFNVADPEHLRSDLHDYLLANEASVLTGFTGDIRFNDGRQRDLLPKLITYDRDAQTPYVLQLNETPALAQSIEDPANYVQIGSLAYRLIPAEKVGLSVLQFYNVDYARGLFDADFVVWLRSKDRPEIDNLVFTNGVGELRNVRTISEVQNRSDNYRSFAGTGTFRFEFTPADIILDSPKVRIQLRDRRFDRSHLQFVEDSDPARAGLNRPAERGGATEYVPASDFLAIEDAQAPAFGDPRSVSGGVTYSVATYEAQLSSRTPGLTAAMVRAFGGKTLAIMLALGAAALLFVVAARVISGRQSLLFLLIPLLWATALVSKGQLFSSLLISGASQQALTYVLWGYDILNIAIVATLIYVLIVRFVLRDAADRPASIVVKSVLQTLLLLAGLAYFCTQNLGLNILPVLATSSVLLTVIGVALRDIILDTFAGVVITGDGSVRVNDWVQVRTRDRVIEGRILNCGWRAVAIQSRDGVMHFIPNSACTSQALTNLTARGEFVRQEVPFYMKTEQLSPGALDDVRRHLVKTLKVQDSSVDWAQPFRVIADRQEGYVTRCLVQFYFDPNLSLAGLRSATLTAIRDVLVAHGAIPEPGHILPREAS